MNGEQTFIPEQKFILPNLHLNYPPWNEYTDMHKTTRRPK